MDYLIIHPATPGHQFSPGRRGSVLLGTARDQNNRGERRDTDATAASPATELSAPAPANAGVAADERPATDDPGPSDALLETRRREWDEDTTIGTPLKPG
jgi:hypothetical protein